MLGVADPQQLQGVRRAVDPALGAYNLKAGGVGGVPGSGPDCRGRPTARVTVRRPCDGRAAHSIDAGKARAGFAASNPVGGTATCFPCHSFLHVGCGRPRSYLIVPFQARNMIVNSQQASVKEPLPAGRAGDGSVFRRAVLIHRCLLRFIRPRFLK